ncbi:hypothetical protein ACKUUI_05980 [Mycobacterium seoulense]|uniref:hypothetical protein n=1 Tax=Mycobacterium seoulense TaxID=386911 RepID=UPI003CF23BA5
MAVISQDEKEAAFQSYLASTVNYNATIEAAGDLPWFRDPEKLTKLERHIPGVTAMTEDERRRALYNRHRPQAGAAQANGSAVANHHRGDRRA